MAKRWLQIRGDPSVKNFVFQQTRQESLFDTHIDRVHDVIRGLLTQKGAFHVKAHYSSDQLTCWFYDDPFNYRVYLGEEVPAAGFLAGFPDIFYENRKPRIGQASVEKVLQELKRLRLSDEQMYLRSGSINRMNGLIGMNFSCDGTHYIDFDEFFVSMVDFGGECTSAG